MRHAQVAGDPADIVPVLKPYGRGETSRAALAFMLRPSPAGYLIIRTRTDCTLAVTTANPA